MIQWCTIPATAASWFSRYTRIAEQSETHLKRKKARERERKRDARLTEHHNSSTSDDASPRIRTGAVAVSHVASTAAGARDVALLLPFLSRSPLPQSGENILSLALCYVVPFIIHLIPPRSHRCVRCHATSSTTGSRATTTDLGRRIESPTTTCVPPRSPRHRHCHHL